MHTQVAQDVSALGCAAAAGVSMLGFFRLLFLRIQAYGFLSFSLCDLISVFGSRCRCQCFPALLLSGTQVCGFRSFEIAWSRDPLF
jgi:hypothetical protein